MYFCQDLSFFEMRPKHTCGKMVDVDGLQACEVIQSLVKLEVVANSEGDE